MRRPTEPVQYNKTIFWGLSNFEKVVSLESGAIGQTARSDVGSYVEIMPLIRSHFAQMANAKAKGLQPHDFSPNHIRGMCRTCWGLGYKNIDLQFLPPVKIICESCRGYRLNSTSLEIRFKEKNLGEILMMTVAEALEIFSEIPQIFKRLETLKTIGLSHLKLGQEVGSLSGGEAQRVRLSRQLAKKESGKTLYLIDEPSIGLHPHDLVFLLSMFHKLVDDHNTLIIIEHNLDIIANADYIIDLGPDAGNLGGHIMGQGTPEDFCQNKNSRTAPYLKERLYAPAFKNRECSKDVR